MSNTYSHDSLQAGLDFAIELRKLEARFSANLFADECELRLELLGDEAAPLIVLGDQAEANYSRSIGIASND